ncbi:MAG: hypothetical protein HAW67_06905 [Endozoicomonadaceae bacterium]|nr:hypothetical protein [Endozoicomonadaceae bacterium]
MTEMNFKPKVKGSPFKKMKAAWQSLPQKARGVYKLSLGVVIIGGYMIITNLNNEPIKLPSAVRMPQDTKNQRDGNSELDHELKVQRKRKEKQRKRDADKSGKSYIPDFAVLESDTDQSIDLSLDDEYMGDPNSKTNSDASKGDGKQDRKLTAQEQIDFYRGGDSKRKPQVVPRTRDDDAFNQLVEQRVKVYQAIAQTTSVAVVPGSIVARSYPKETTSEAVDKGTSNNNTNTDLGKVADLTPSNVLTPGDVIAVQLDNYINTDESGSFVRMTMLSPIEGAIIMGEYAQNDGVLNITTSTLSYEGKVIGFPGIVVTADTKMRSGLSTDTDYHSIYRWSALILGGALQGIGEAYLNASDEVIVNGDTVIKTNKRDSKDLLFGVAKGVGDKFSSIVQNEFNTPPTVVLDPTEEAIYGIMVTDLVDLTGFPEIDRNEVY